MPRRLAALRLVEVAVVEPQVDRSSNPYHSDRYTHRPLAARRLCQSAVHRVARHPQRVDHRVFAAGTPYHTDIALARPRPTSRREHNLAARPRHSPTIRFRLVIYFPPNR